MLQSANFMKSWNRNETSTLIILFESENVLYDHSHPEYYNLEQRNAAYSRILEIMQRVDSNCTLLQIKRKLRVILSEYTAEARRKTAAVASGTFREKNYRPSLWCFNLLNFLDKCGPPYVMKHDFRSIETKASKGIEDDENESSEPSSSGEGDNCIDPDDLCSFEISVCGLPTSVYPSPASEALNTRHNIENGKCLPRDKDLKAGTKLTKLKRTRPVGSLTIEKEPTKEKMTMFSYNEEQSAKRKARGANIPTPEESVNAKKKVCDKTSSRTEKQTEQKKPGHNLSLETQEPCLVESVVTQRSLDREDIFGQYVASEIKTLWENPLLYLQTKKAILDIVTNASFELLNPE